MNLPKLAVVVLNYNNYKDTILCVDSLLEQTYDNFDIIVVENGSPNDSYAVLKKKYNQNKNIILLKNENNLGFAKGNNIGINYAVKILKLNFVFVLNSDTIVHRDLINEIMLFDFKDDIAVISPTIIDELGNYQKPIIKLNNINIFTLKSCYKLLLAIFLNVYGVKNVYKLYKLRKQHLKTNSIVIEEGFKPSEKYEYSMQGSAYFLTPNFFKYYDHIYPNTFLYWEEINLMWYIHKVNLSAVLIDTSPVIHKESKSVSLQTTSDKLTQWKLKKSFQSMMNSIPMFFYSYSYINIKFNNRK
jgi:GT2 family glycosyltransferase